MAQTSSVISQHNLPEDLTSLVGRERDQDDVRGLLDSNRVVSLVGPGGVGKTRLALAIARAMLADFSDGVWLIELGSIRDQRLVPDVVAQSAGILPTPKRPVIETLIGAFGSNRVLLVLDNCEHLVQKCAELVEQLVQACPHVKVLVTSREPLRVAGEIVWPISPLRVPQDPVAGLDVLAENESVRLFVQRARAIVPGFELSENSAAAVIEVCRRLDGLPLALELAAPMLKVLSPEELVARLDDRFALLVRGSRTAPARQQTLESAVGWSYDLLELEDRRVFEHLSVFPADFSLESAAAVCDLDSQMVLRGLANLVDQSLVVASSDTTGPRRYHLLETLRAYASKRLGEHGEGAPARHHLLMWVRASAEQAGAALRGPGQADWLRWAEREHRTVRSSLEWASKTGDADALLHIAAGLWWAWLLHHRWTEAYEWLERAVSMSAAEPRTVTRGRVLQAAATAAAFRGEYALAQVRLDECFSVARELQDDDLLLAAHSGRALLLQQQGLIDAAQTHVQAVLELAQRLDRPWYQARAAEFVASRALRNGDLSAAADHLNRAVQLARAAGDSWNVAQLLGQLGDVERMRGTHARAAPLYLESIRLFQDLGLSEDPSRVHNLGYVALAQGQTVQAADYFIDALRVFRRIGDRRGVADGFIGLGCVRSAERRPADAARLFGAGEALLEALGSTVWPSNQADYQHWQRIARASLGSTEWEEAWTSARALGADRILEELLLPHQVLVPRTSGRAAAPADALTPREREVAQLAARGLSNRRIGETLVIAEKTAANHLQNALEKLDVHSRSELAARALELGLLP